jgi:hypothetical protein
MRKDAKMEEMEGTRLMIFRALPTLLYRRVRSSLSSGARGNHYSASRTNRPYSFCLYPSLGEKAALLFSVAEMQPVSLQNTKVG